MRVTLSPGTIRSPIRYDPPLPMLPLFEWIHPTDAMPDQIHPNAQAIVFSHLYLCKQKLPLPEKGAYSASRDSIRLSLHKLDRTDHTAHRFV